MRHPAPWTTMPQYAKPEGKREFRRIPSRTQQRARDEREYCKRVRKWIKLPENRWCKCCIVVNGQTDVVGTKATPFNRAEQCHHKYGRLGPLLLEQKHWIPVCAKCHEQIHKFPNWARALGMLAEPGQWNRPPKV